MRLTADGVPVLVHGSGLRRGPHVHRLRRADLPAQIPSLAELWESCGSDFLLALDMVDPAAAGPVIALARHYGAVPRLWLTYWRLPAMLAWRQRWPEVRLVYATMFGVPEAVLRRTVRRAAEAGVDAINLHHRLVRARTAETVHAAGLKLFVWGLLSASESGRLARLGADAIFVDRLVR